MVLSVISVLDCTHTIQVYSCDYIRFYKMLPNNPFCSGRPNIYASLSGYTDLTRDNSTTAMAQIECYTTNSPPTHVIWQKNGEIINTDGFMYDEIQIVTDHRNSHYRNVLLVNDLVSVVGDLTFSCNVSNVNGSASLNIPTAITSGNVFLFC